MTRSRSLSFLAALLAGVAGLSAASCTTTGSPSGSNAPAANAPAAGEEAEPYAPKYEDAWPEVRRHVRTGWMTGRAANPNLPSPFLKLSGGWGIMFYWDTYFQNRGLLRDGHFRWAKNHVDNLLYEVDKVGFVPNATAEWGRNRSQIPYLSLMVRDLYEHWPSETNGRRSDSAPQGDDPQGAPATDGDAKRAWLRSAYGALRTEYRFWTEPGVIEDHSTDLPGLQRFSSHATRAELLAFYDLLPDRLPFPRDTTTEAKLDVAERYLCEAEVMDFTPRFERRCPDFAAVDLNSNLYQYEKNFAWMARELGLSGQPDWEARAEQRRERIRRRLWNEKRGLFMDYDFENDRFSRVAAASAFYPLFVGLATEKQAKRTVENLPLFEHEWGLAATDSNPYAERIDFQWGRDDGWPPVYLIAVEGLRRYGYERAARRLAMKYLDLTAKNFLRPRPATFVKQEKQQRRERGHLYEKYDVTMGRIADEEYAANVFMGWSAAVYAYLYDYVTGEKSNAHSR